MSTVINGSTLRNHLIYQILYLHLLSYFLYMSGNYKYTKDMFQVNFSEQSMNELNQLDTRSQMTLVETFSNLTQKQLDNPSDDIGRFNRNNKTYYRVRAGEFRIYFEQDKDGLFAHYILHKNTLSDFVFRFKLPVTEEFMIEQHDSFWKYLESIRNHSDETK